MPSHVVSRPRQASKVACLVAIGCTALSSSSGCDEIGDLNPPASSGAESGAADASLGARADGDTGQVSADGAPAPPEMDAGPPPVGNVSLVPGVMVSTLAGAATNGARDGTGSAAEFDNPTGIAIDKSGNLVVTDYDDALLRLVTPQGVVTTVASGSTFVDPFDVVVADDGSYYVGTDADETGSKSATSGTVWRVTPPVGAAVATPLVVARGMYRPRGLALAANGGLFASDRDESLVAVLPSPIGVVSFLAGTRGTAGFRDGTGHAVQFNAPVGVATLSDGSWVVADSYNNRIRRVTASGVVTTLAGDGTYAVNDGPAGSAQFAFPSAVAADAVGNVYVSDIASRRIRRIDPTGNVQTLAGDGQQAYADGPGGAAEFYGQEGLAVTPDGKSVYVADGNGGNGSAHSHIRKLSIP
jgi:sugar lactone lactonase YvrE